MCLPDLNLDFPARRVTVMSALPRIYQGREAGASTIWTADQSRRWVLAIVQPEILAPFVESLLCTALRCFALLALLVVRLGLTRFLVGVGLCSPLSRYYHLLPVPASQPACLPGGSAVRVEIRGNDVSEEIEYCTRYREQSIKEIDIAVGANEFKHYGAGPGGVVSSPSCTLACIAECSTEYGDDG